MPDPSPGIRLAQRAVAAAAIVGGGSASAQEAGGSRPDPEDIRRSADEILARDEFSPAEPNPLARAWGRVLEWFGERLSGLFEDSSGNPALGWLIILVFLAVVLYFVWRFLRRLQSDPTADDLPDLPDEGWVSADWAAAAAELEARGDYKEAMRYRFRALVLELTERDLVADVPGRTAGEFRIDLAGSAPDLSEDFSAASELFELAFYGDVQTGPEESRRFQGLSTQVIERAGR